MASSSNSTSSALVTLPRRSNHYDVFVTFRGEDTRNNFTDHLFYALHREGIFAFRDDTNLPKGESIGPELLCAIENSQVFVVVLSRNYAFSTWCLQELEKILECVKVSKKHVLPVFYDVDPSMVRKQSGIYGEAFVKHEQRFQQDSQMVQRWREALTQVSNLSGWDLRDKRQSPEIKKIVQRIINILDCKFSCVSNDLVGMDSHMQELEKLLLLDSVNDGRVIGICGMGGIGKTTLATALFAKISNQFDACCFIDDVSKKFRLHDGPLSVQKQILHQTLSEEHHQICNLHNASNLIRRRLCRQSVLLIFDNVDKVEQLEKIVVRREWLGAGSKIIIISRDEHILKEYGVDEVYKVPLLDWTNSLQLLCRKAFKLDHILNSYEGLVNGILHYANGLPLAIKVLGSFLFERDISEWESALARLRESPHNDVMDVLRLSFDGLNKIEKELFLHIACFFNWHNAKYVKNVLNCCGFHAHIGLRVLIDKSLVSIEEEIQMHDLLQELGRNIVQENSSKERRKWSRLWLKEQFCDVMLENMEKHVEAMVLDSEIRFDGEEMDVTILKHFSNLRLLIIEDVDISGSLSCLSNKLRYFEWHEYPFKYLPSNFQPNQLVQLILKHSCIKQLWKGRKYLPNLRTLDLSYSTHLIKVPNFGEFPNLEHFNLEGCKKLLWLDPSIGLLRKIVSLNLKDCKNLVSIPNNIFGLSSLKDLNMAGCSKVFNNPWDLNISESVLLFLPNSPFPTPTPTAETNWLTSIISLSCLVKLDISFCGLNQLPDAIGCLHWLEELNLGGNKFVTLPSLRDLSKLVCLNLEHCKLLEYLPQLPFPTAIEPGLHKTNLRKKIIVKTRGLFIFNCPQLHEREHYFSSMAFSWLIQFILMNPQSFPDSYDIIQIVTPGSEIPSWLKNQNKGDSIRIDSSPIMHDNNNNIIGCVCCVVFSMAPDPPARYPSHIALKFVDIHGQANRTTSISVILIDSLITVKSNHIWLTYFPLESSWDVRNEAMCVATCHGGLFIEVKNLGYHWVYKQDFNLTKMNHRTLAGKRKYLAIEDEAQPQPQPKLHSTSKLPE